MDYFVCEQVGLMAHGEIDKTYIDDLISGNFLQNYINLL